MFQNLGDYKIQHYKEFGNNTFENSRKFNKRYLVIMFQKELEIIEYNQDEKLIEYRSNAYGKFKIMGELIEKLSNMIEKLSHFEGQLKVEQNLKM